ncbi:MULTISPECIES: hypothetical protein [unclassified Phaeobacter]|uniref:hypothetical protein n=1 Tax=unclassified Phaeobacter TaxID=2621772 RepID=UPI003A876BF4
MVDLTTIGAALAAVKGSIETLKAGSELYQTFARQAEDPTKEELQSVAQQLAEELYKARMTALEAQNQLLEFQAHAKAEEKFEETLGHYMPMDTDAGGTYMALNDDAYVGLLFEAVCPNCVVKHKEFYPLQKKGYLYSCGNCDAKIPREKVSQPSRIQGRVFG